MNMTLDAARNMGGLGRLEPWMVPLGYYEDDRGNVYYPDGTMAYGPDVLSQTRERVGGGSVFSNANTGGRVLQLPNGQTVRLTEAQFQQYLAQGNAGLPGSQIASGLGTGFSQLAGSFGVSPTTFMLLLIGGAYLLFREPPQRKR